MALGKPFLTGWDAGAQIHHRQQRFLGAMEKTWAGSLGRGVPSSIAVLLLLPLTAMDVCSQPRGELGIGLMFPWAAPLPVSDSLEICMLGKGGKNVFFLFSKRVS